MKNKNSAPQAKLLAILARRRRKILRFHRAGGENFNANCSYTPKNEGGEIFTKGLGFHKFDLVSANFFIPLNLGGAEFLQKVSVSKPTDPTVVLNI